MRSSRRNSREAPTCAEQAFLDDRFEHRLQLARRTGQQHDQLAARARSTGLAPCRSCSAAPTAPRGTIAWRRLISGVRRPRAAKRFSMSSKIVGVIFERLADEVGDDVARQIVIGRTEPAGQNQQDRFAEARRPRSSSGRRDRRRRSTFPCRSMPSSLSRSVMNSELVSMMRGRQHLAADRDDFCLSSRTHPGAR